MAPEKTKHLSGQNGHNCMANWAVAAMVVSAVALAFF